jgi:hypothetical protein
MSKVLVKRDNVFFTGLKLLDPADAKRIKDLIYERYITLERELKAPGKLKLNFKKYEHGGREKYSVHLMIDYPGKPITAEKVYNPVRYDVVGIVHKLLDKARREIIKKFKTNTSYKKPY